MILERVATVFGVLNVYLFFIELYQLSISILSKGTDAQKKKKELVQVYVAFNLKNKELNPNMTQNVCPSTRLSMVHRMPRVFLLYMLCARHMFFFISTVHPHLALSFGTCYNLLQITKARHFISPW